MSGRLKKMLSISPRATWCVSQFLSAFPASHSNPVQRARSSGNPFTPCILPPYTAPARPNAREVRGIRTEGSFQTTLDRRVPGGLTSMPPERSRQTPPVQPHEPAVRPRSRKASVVDPWREPRPRLVGEHRRLSVDARPRCARLWRVRLTGHRPRSSAPPRQRAAVWPALPRRAPCPRRGPAAILRTAPPPWIGSRLRGRDRHARAAGRPSSLPPQRSKERSQRNPRTSFSAPPGARPGGWRARPSPAPPGLA